ncbi:MULTISPECIES: photosystem II repair protein Psb32 [unclassified Coleofasciculus]|uniref:photosystem II repair protein Psb32 n=1 Tax=unclassified Coleofasciculus TaxID=2692782 RepID=UPI00187FEA1F|nr:MULTISPECIES: TPM domain-containing protein [unclassified Coleofasciculus]MBE9127228.1 TPM domain-containing protein [Coleofasciculus sp. LEGE 07081]MBE9150520.1 TPM domain-containing protein [Coleofasciculus sp. LEGE 07092]
MRRIFKQLYKERRKYLQRLMLPLLLLTAISGLVAAPANATNVYQMPNVSAGEPTWVIDTAEVLSRLSEGKLSNNLDSLAKNTGQEVRMVTIRRLDYGETAESFTQALFEKWYPTPEAQANQILLVIDTVTNNTAIATGEAVKSIMPDDIAQSVASETMTAPLRDGNKYNQAFLDASNRLVAILSGQPDPGPPVVEDQIQVEGTFKTAEETDTNNATIWVVAILVIATVVPMATYFFYQGFS